MNKSINESLNEIIEESSSKEDDKASSHLSQEKEKIELGALEERFLWIISTIILFDILFLKDCSNWSLPWIIGIFELVVIFILSERYDIKSFRLLFNRVQSIFERK